MNFKSLKFIFKPSYWIMNNPYSPLWDKQLNHLLDNFEFKNIRQYSATLDGVEIWIGNHPYSSFTSYYDGRKRPSRLTIEKAHKKLCQESLKQFKQRHTPEFELTKEKE